MLHILHKWSLIAVVASTSLFTAEGASDKSDFFVDPILGSDLSDGQSRSTPFRTLHRAAHAIASSPLAPRRVVHLLPGEYELNETLVLGGRHGNCTWKADRRGVGRETEARTGRVRVRGGYRIPSLLFQPWTNNTDIYVAPIDSAAGDLGAIQSGLLGDCANSKAELYFDGRPQILARYPNIKARTGVWQWERIRNVTGNDSFTFAGHRPMKRNYHEAPDLWLHGYWSFDWADNYVKVASIDAKTKTYTIDTNASQILYSLKLGARYYAVNLLQELDVPGEYYIDRRRRLLYLYPPSPINSESEIILSTIENLVTASGVSDLVFKGIDFSISRGTTLNFTSVAGVNIIGGSVANVGGPEAIKLSNSADSQIVGVTVSSCSCGGVKISGGDRRSLTPSGILVRKNRISNLARWKRTYMPGVSFDGCGHVVTGNIIFDSPHEGISGSGNDCIFSDNHLYDLCYEASDAGAFYAGRSWAERGNVVQNNLFERIRAIENATLGYSHVQAIYLDDQMSGYAVINNTVVDSDTGVLIGGGRNNKVIGNEFIRTALPLSFDNRGLNWDNTNCKVGGSFQNELTFYHYKRPPWSLHYPEVQDTFDDRPCTPVHNAISAFTFCGHGKSWIETPGTSMEELVLWDNLFVSIAEDPSLCNSSVTHYQRDSSRKSKASDGVMVACAQ